MTLLRQLLPLASSPSAASHAGRRRVRAAPSDTPLPIGFNKTISQPFITALMTDLLTPEPDEKVLEIGTGMGYDATLPAELVGRVCSVEIVEEFASEAESRLREMAYRMVEIRVGDGSRGWAEHAPYDKVVVTAAADEAPPALLRQLKPGGRMVLPMGADYAQMLTVVHKYADGGIHMREFIPVAFTRLVIVI
jgi:protein-L-isoaspartate(D-aspartate) O-methyltransferase